MPEFTLHRNYLMQTTKGHSIRFVKDKPVNVPAVCIEDAVAIGARPVNPEDGDVIGEEEVPQPTLSPDERKAKVFEAFDTMKKRAERSDFTASGVPNAKRLPALTGFEVSTKERDNYWREYKVLEQEARDQEKLDRQVVEQQEENAES